MDGSRGTTTVADRVIEKTASQVLRLRPEVERPASRMAAFGARGSLPAVSAQLSGRSCTLAVRVGLRYPCPIAASADALRRRLMAEVEDLTGVRVRQVDVDVVSLSPQAEAIGERRPL
ncbi:cell envelope-related Asp23 family protein [Brevibacterium sanguinis]|uniref:Cell envelope-related Asp23 family protein n=2 Tax=Brevibacterium TaxID=1696 RepID=A0A366INR4_9MICO|nr:MULTISPECIES: Asp23/Gls24 family envelope stress response protein [Brevibacterium]RBP66994.1 cell envelope-related Asp23 family protein [Brevibacterium sanguinis]RBP73519.1 cell envelope-related Asp23 family protein [Brevibacterium celere]